MIETPTVLILGAGASWDYGFPTGPRLKAAIWKMLSDDTFRDVYPSSTRNLRRFQRSLELTPDLSIDAFLEHNFEEFGEAGKAAIASILLPFEKEVNLFGGWMQRELEGTSTNDCDIPEGGQHWYSYLFNKMSESCIFGNFKNNRLTVVTFNYDRSFEWFMLQALNAKYQKSIDECKEVLKSIPIIHIYGQLGEIMPDDKQCACIEYDSWDKLDLWEMSKAVQHAAKSIKIIHEEHGLENLYKSQQAFSDAEKIYFLGFGYHMTNMEKLFRRIDKLPEDQLKITSCNLLNDKGHLYGKKCRGTAYGLSPHHRNQLEKFGLHNIKAITTESRRRNKGEFSYFPDSTIYDFLVYNQNSAL